MDSNGWPIPGYVVRSLALGLEVEVAKFRGSGFAALGLFMG